MQVLHNFLALLLDAAPWFVIGVLIGAALQAWLKPEWVTRWIGAGQRSVVTATVAGAVLPGCALSTIPVAESLRSRGAKVGTLAAFIMVAPLISPHTIAMTATLISLPVAIARVVLSVATALLLGWILNRSAPGSVRGRVFPDAQEASCCSSGSGCGEAMAYRSPAKRFWHSLLAITRSLTIYFVVGLLAAAFVQTFVPHTVMSRYLSGGWISYAIAVVAGMPAYVCDGGEVPLTRALLEVGVGLGPAFTFMLGAVGTCIPTIAMLPRIIGWKPTTLYLVAWLLLAVGGGVMMDSWSHFFAR